MASPNPNAALDFEHVNARDWDGREQPNRTRTARPSAAPEPAQRSDPSGSGSGPGQRTLGGSWPQPQSRTTSQDSIRYPYGRPRLAHGRTSQGRTSQDRSYRTRQLSESSRDSSEHYGHFRTPNVIVNPEEDEYEYDGPEGFMKDNEADKAERDGAPPHSSFQLPVRRHTEFDDRFFGPRNSNIRHIARKTNTHLSLPTSMDDFVIQMWGTDAQVRAARADLLLLLEQVQQNIDQGTRRVGGWIKINAAPTDRKQAHMDRMARDALIRRKYRHTPEDGAVFNAAGVFIWPYNDLNPQTCLGMSLEALDDIRFEQLVHITYLRKRNMFRVVGDDAKNVEDAVDRIYGTFCEIAAKNRKTNKMALVQPPSMMLPAINVGVNRHHDLIGRQMTIKRVSENVGIQVFLTGPKPTKRFLDWWKKMKKSLQDANDTYVKAALSQGLQDVIYHRGYARLKIYFGKFVLFGYKKSKSGEYSLDEFASMMQNAQTAAEVIRTIGSRAENLTDEEVAQELITSCTNSADLFQPLDADAEAARESGEQNEPSVSATFDLKLFDDRGHSIEIRLHVEFNRVPGVSASDHASGRAELYKPGPHHWLNLSSEVKVKQSGDNISRRRCPVDVKAVDLEADLAYQIELLAQPLYKDTDIYPIFQEFVRRLRVESIPDESDPAGPPEAGHRDGRRHINRVSFANLPGLSVIALTQKTKWRYWMQNTQYVFEVTKYEHLPVSEVSALYPDGIAVSYRGLRTEHDIRWGASLWNDDWDEMLSQQRHNHIGRKGSWPTDIEEFFTPSGAGSDDGFTEMMGRVQECIRLIKMARDTAGAKKRGQPAPGRAWVGNEEFDE